RASAPGPDDDEIAGAEVAAALPVDLDGNVRNEERLADELLAAPVDLDDEEVGQLDPEEAADGQTRPCGAEQQARANQDQGVQRERECIHVAACVEGAAVQERGQ